MKHHDIGTQQKKEDAKIIRRVKRIEVAIQAAINGSDWDLLTQDELRLLKSCEISVKLILEDRLRFFAGPI